MEKKIFTKNNTMTRAEAFDLNTAILKIKSGSLSVSTMVKYIELREALAAFIESFNSAKKEMSLQTMPEGWKEGDSMEEWNKAFFSLLNEYVKGEVDINAHILTKEEVCQIYMANQDKPGDQLDYIKRMMTIKDDQQEEKS